MKIFSHLKKMNFGVYVVGILIIFSLIGIYKIYTGPEKLGFTESPQTKSLSESNLDKTKSLQDRIEVLEALYIALNKKADSVKNRPQILIQKAYVTNEKGSITIEEIKENLSKEWKDNKIKEKKK